MNTTRTIADAAGKTTLEGFSQAEKYNKWLLNQFRRHIKGPKVLEIGCGLGNISKLLCEEFELSALDICSEYTEHTAKELGITTACHDISVKPYKKNHFDSAFIVNVLEHIPDEQKALANIKLALKPGGHLAVLVPAFMWLYGTVDEAIDHQRRYTRRTLRAALEKAGYEVSSVSYFNVFGMPGWLLHNRILKKDTLPDGQLKLFDTLVPVLKPVDVLFRKLMGISVVAHAIKPAR